MRKTSLIILILLAGAVCHAQVPTISSVSVWNGVRQQTGCTSVGAGCTTDTNAVTITYTASGTNSHCWVQYGVASGTYLWASYDAQTGGTSAANYCSIPIGGLKDGTTYYFLPTARPDADDETNICNVAGCGAVEQVATTPASSVSHLPAPPNSVQANLLCEPDSPSCSSYSTPYVTVPLAAIGPGGECVSTASVSAPSGYTGSISIGDSLTTIFAAPGTKLWFGTVFQVPQGTTCIVPDTDTFGHGYNLPVLGIDPLATGGLITAANHRWIIFRTQQLNATDFPPFGGRTNPSFVSHMGGFQQLDGTPEGRLLTGGSIFTATAAGQFHHIWIENLELSVNPTALVDHDVLMMFGRGEGGQPAPFPQYVVMRGNYLHSPARAPLSTSVLTPYVFGLTFGTMGANMQWALVGNYADNMEYGDYGYPVGFYFSDCGFGGACGYGGPVLIDNNYVQGMGEPFYVEVNNHANPTPYDFTVTHNDTYMTAAELAYAKALANTSHYYTCGRAMVEFKGMTRALIRGNYFNGQAACSNNGAPLIGINVVDYAAVSNYITNSASLFTLVGNDTGSGIQQFSSTSNRALITNNIAYNLGFSNMYAGGAGFPFILQMESSPQNVTFTNNTVGQIGDSGGYYDQFIAGFANVGAQAGLTFQSNVLPFGIGGEGAPFAGGINVYPLCEYWPTCSHPASPGVLNAGNPVAFTAWLQSAAGVADGGAGSGMTATSTIGGGSGYSNGSLAFGSGCSGSVGVYSVAGSEVQQTGLSNFGTCAPASGFTVTPIGAGTGASLRPHYGLTTRYNWGGNIVVCTTYMGTDMSAASCSALCPGGSSSSWAYTMPSGDSYPCASNTTARYIAAGYPNLSFGDGRCAPTRSSSCSVGANTAAIESALGVVSRVSVAAGPTYMVANYVAPDALGCYVDILGQSRTSDGGGGRSRSVLVTGLSSNTAYSWRILCYFDQSEARSAGWYSFASDPSNQETSGSITTSAWATRSVSIGYTLPFGASQAIVIDTPESGSPVTTYCTSSCTVRLPTGIYSQSISYETSDSVQVGLTSTSTVVVE